jgi:hypothetical protein
MGIYHLADGGLVTTNALKYFECGTCKSTWVEKLDVWQDCAPYPDDPTPIPVDVAKQPPVRNPALPRVGTVDIKAAPIVEVPIQP